MKLMLAGTPEAQHIKTNKEAKRATANLKQVCVTSMMHPGNKLSQHEFKVHRAEVKLSIFVAEHHILIAVMDH